MYGKWGWVKATDNKWIFLVVLSILYCTVYMCNVSVCTFAQKQLPHAEILESFTNIFSYSVDKSKIPVFQRVDPTYLVWW